MTSDALYLVELFRMQNGVLKTELLSKTLRRKKFDKYSYSSWAIEELLGAINECSGCVTVGTIRELIRIMMTDYDRYYNVNKDKNVRYKYALEALNELFKITGGYVHE